MSELRDIATRLRSLNQFFDRLMQRLCDAMIDVLKANTPGEHLPEEWTSRIQKSGDGVTARIWNTRPENDAEFDIIMIYLNYGTVNHWVEPVNAQALHWVEDGISYFSKGHWVSGIRASHFAAKASRVIGDFERQAPAMFAAYIERGTLP